jgi:AraC-like DNA-binding protein
MDNLRARSAGRRPAREPAAEWPTAMNEPLQRVAVLALVPTLLRRLGADPQEVTAAAGVKPGLLKDAANMMPFALVGRLLHQCSSSTGCPHFALLLGKQSSLSRLGVPGQLSLSANTVGVAIASLIKHQHLNTSGAVSFLSRRGEDAALHYGIYARGVEGTDHIKSLAIGVYCNAMRSLCGAGWRPTEVHLALRPPADDRPYRQFFLAPVRFNTQKTALIFPSRWLKHPVPSSDPAGFKQLLSSARATGEPDLVVRVRRAVSEQLLERSVSQDEVARSLAWHRRTMSRRLRLQGTSYQKILDEVQFAIACQILRDTDVRVAEIAALFGYSDASGFIRAFRRWSGRTPERWRVEHATAVL